jgi:plasmid stabilization system protein ParE
MENRIISWDKMALNQFGVAIEYIAKNSVQNAEKVRLDIIKKIESLPSNPEMFPLDKYKLSNDGFFRAFELHRLRIAYYIEPHRVRILRIRHTSREPEEF